MGKDCFVYDKKSRGTWDGMTTRWDICPESGRGGGLCAAAATSFGLSRDAHLRYMWLEAAAEDQDVCFVWREGKGTRQCESGISTFRPLPLGD